MVSWLGFYLIKSVRWWSSRGSTLVLEETFAEENTSIDPSYTARVGYHRYGQAVDYAKKSCDGWIVLPDGTANDIPCRRSRGIHPSGKTVHPSQDLNDSIFHSIYQGRQSTKDPWQAVDYAKKSCDGWTVFPDGWIPRLLRQGMSLAVPSGRTIHPSQDFFA